MTFRHYLFTFSFFPISATVLASGCGSGDCENTGSCGDYQTGGSAGDAGRGGNGGTSGSGAAGGDSGQGGTAASAGTSASGGTGAAGAGTSGAGESGSNTTGGRSGASGSGGTLAGDGGMPGGDGGMGGALPCDGECGGDTPVCDTTTETCVGCLTGEDCEGDTPACDTSEHECVECTTTDAEACEGETPVCNDTSHVCVECIANTGCTQANASKCSGNECTGCTGNGDCTHIAGLGVCNAGTCVECTVTDETACGGNSCNPETHECTDTPRGSVGTCEPCIADSECEGEDQEDPENRCVPMKFQGVSRSGGFCLRRSAKICGAPYQTRFSVASLSHAPEEEYCGIAQSITTCEAVLDFIASRSCTLGQDQECGCTRDTFGVCTGPGQGGLCRELDSDLVLCTYPCGAMIDCSDGKTCAGAPTMYCQPEG